MSLHTVSTGGQINASDVNQLVNVLQQPSGNQEKGGYYLDSWSNASNDEAGAWVSCQSRGSTPLSVSLDQSLSSATTCNAPSTNALNQYGFHVYTTSTGAAIKFYVGGIYTLQY